MWIESEKCAVLMAPDEGGFSWLTLPAGWGTIMWTWESF